MIYSVQVEEGHSMRFASLALTIMAVFFVATFADAREGQPCIPKATEAHRMINLARLAPTGFQPSRNFMWERS
jgi:hypothetical protein